MTPVLSESQAAALACLAHHYKPALSARPKDSPRRHVAFAGSTEAREAFKWSPVRTRTHACACPTRTHACACPTRTHVFLRSCCSG